MTLLERTLAERVGEGTGMKIIGFLGGAVNYIILVLIIMPMAFAGYALWDSKQIHRAADKSNYAVYKPTAENSGKSFEELRAVNPEVFAWLSVYGTNIDYPVTRADDNMKYVNTNAEGLYSLSGSIFLDSGNNTDFSDFNNILYGHHMAKKVMFGEIESFSDIDFFETRRYGNLYFDGADHGIEFFAFVQTDAYDFAVFKPVVTENQRGEFLSGLLDKASHTRDIGATEADRIVLLTTCSLNSTNGRDILAGRITEETFDYRVMDLVNADKTEHTDPEDIYGYVRAIPARILYAAIILLIILAAYLAHRVVKGDKTA